MPTTSRKQSEVAPTGQGYLNKHANALKGYQSRFFVINMEHGRLEYFLTKGQFTDTPNDYRGCILLAGAEVAPREEDSVSFNVFGASGEVFQLKADTAKDRQKWVDAIRSAVQKLNEATIDPLAVKLPNKEPSRGLSGKKKKKVQEASKSTFLPPTQEMVNTREAIAAAETALNEMSEIIASYPVKVIAPSRAEKEQTQQNPNQSLNSEAPSHKKGGGGGELSKYEEMLKIKAFSVACLQDLKVCFEAVQAEYLRTRAS
ncbi:oxysterol-binding protein-related protein 11-like isoform X2 [Symsagittifera roscoffensis]|uniref:oxysterol-binding protein-related protein 11-like isoform X2 n=1 Tax=Symsagittifera roscoffensis TaxID=84072 RepID=UPI00307C40F8